MRNAIGFICLFIFSLFASASTVEDPNPPLIPYWAFGHWVWEDAKNTRPALESLVDAYRSHEIPVDAVICDSPWMTSYNDFQADESRYPEMKGMIDGLHSKGVRILLFYTGAINSSSAGMPVQENRYFRYVIDKKLVINGGAESKWFKGTGVHVDFTNPHATEWWNERLLQLHELGADGAKVDFAHRWFGDTVETSIGTMTNRQFGYHYFKENLNSNVRLNSEFVQMTYAYSGRGLIGWPSTGHVHWVGDFGGDWKGMKDQLTSIYRSAQAGFSGIACEIGGYWDKPSNKEQLIRYAQMACFVPIMINGGNLGAFEHHLPWNFNEEATDLYRNSVRLHRSLSAYLFSAAVEAHLTGIPIIRSSSIEAGSHRLGDALFIQTIADAQSERSVQLPAGAEWIDFFAKDRTYAGGSEIKRIYPLSEYPVFIKAGSVIPIVLANEAAFTPLGRDGQRVVYRAFPKGLTTTTLFEPVGAGANYRTTKITMDEEKRSMVIERETTGAFEIEWHCSQPPTRVQGAVNWTYDHSKRAILLSCSGAAVSLHFEASSQ